ncbi:hypothetical protein [Pseudorhodoferax sp.]|uniref:hypothetical protein n=1 Tax=Pseudorhodoferax sp. TaxID=1993553 RepID=UPI002DD6AD48|nr:hypothetical protein [Pseudorhodoferax sp.]
MTQKTTFVIPTDRFAAVVAAITLSALPAAAQDKGSAPQTTVGVTQAPRQDGTTRSGAPRPRPAASTLLEEPKSERDAQNPPGHKKGATTPRDSDSGSIIGTPK